MKNFNTFLGMVSLACVLAGCDSTSPAQEGPAQTTVCPAESYQDLIGGTEENALDTLVDLFLLGGSQLEVRYINEGEAVDMFYRPDRMNIELNSRGIVTGVNCG